MATPRSVQRALTAAPVVAAVVLPAGCRRKPGPPTPPASASAPGAASAEAPRSLGCSAVERGASFLIGKRSARRDASAEDVEMPFAVEIGSGVARDGGFAVGALRSLGGGTGAVVALVGSAGASGRVVDLGAVHGDVDPPRLAARGGTVYVAVSDNDAGSGTVRLATVREPGGGSDVSWGATVEVGRDGSTAFDFALGKKRGAVVWDEWDRAAGHSTIRISTFDPNELSSVTRARVVSPQGTDAEAPRLAVRPGGLWLAWVAHALADAGAAKRRTGASGESVWRWLEIVPLDENGARAGEPTAVTPRRGDVTTFDLASGEEGEALLAWRLGNELVEGKGSSARLAAVRPDGSVEVTIVPDEDLGPGVPSLVTDAREARASTWLSIASVVGATRLAAVTPDGELERRLTPDPAVGSAEVLAAGGGRLLLAKPAGLAAEISVVRCGR